ncbi:MAG: YdcF family protein [Clostridia bacterium]|nr:YdcF family protein [Clostridia bacterium]
MRKAAKQIGICAMALILFCVLCRLTVFRTYTAHIPIQERVEQALREDNSIPRTESDHADVLRLGDITLRPGSVNVPIRPNQAGEADVRLYDQQGNEIAFQVFRVGPLGTVYDPQTGGFTGDTAVLIAVTLFWFFVSAIMIWHYFQAKGPDYYAYSTIYYAGFSLFAMLTGITMLLTTVQYIVRPESYNMFSAYNTINGASKLFMMQTMPFILLFALAMAISNAALLRHERAHVQNVLGLAVSVFLIAGEALGFYLFTRDFMGSEWEGRIQSTLENVYATAFVYFECMLIGSAVCGIKAAKHQPKADKDYIMILGCWFRKDGSLPPLLRGRVDRALSFWRQQKEESGKEAILIPSGGQGRDEPMPEAEAMRRYLISQGVQKDRIRTEAQSQNTNQNMAFSKQIINSINPEGKTLFATTNYHVFRSGVWANMAGLKAEGVGEKTKWWYWPNAFMRECAGLLQKRWKQEILLLIVLIAFFGVLSMVLG